MKEEEEEEEEIDLDRIRKWRTFLDHNIKTEEESQTYDLILL